MLIGTTACEHGQTSSRKVIVSRDFLEKLDSEIDQVEACCPAMIQVYDDWVTQNAPD